MGAFHEGHISLMRRSTDENDVSIVSLFVNPTQFGAGEDYERYPRDLARDSELAESAGVSALYCPSVEEMYPAGPEVTVRVSELGARWEGERRPGHFDGVAGVCARLFTILPADRAYFGQKDYQQLKVIQRLVRALHFRTEIVAMPTCREPDGLAMSSRNVYLNDRERAAAPLLYRGLSAARAEFDSGERSGPRLEAAVRRALAPERIVMEDYIAAVDSETLEPLKTVSDSAVILAAVRIGRTRLIDNLLLAG
jgi:pantoate--beta-alanine ligase